MLTTVAWQTKHASGLCRAVQSAIVFGKLPCRICPGIFGDFDTRPQYVSGYNWDSRISAANEFHAPSYFGFFAVAYRLAF